MNKVFDLCFEFLSAAIVDMREGILTTEQVKGLLLKVKDKDMRGAMTKILSCSDYFEGGKRGW